jgi:hypothetical protein
MRGSGRSSLQSLADQAGDYIAFLNYIEETPEIDRKFQELRYDFADATQLRVTVGYGPRFLHSTGQLHKGGPDTGVFFQIIANDADRLRDSRRALHVHDPETGPGTRDFRALVKRGRRVIGIDLGDNTLSGLDDCSSIRPRITRIKPDFRHLSSERAEVVRFPPHRTMSYATGNLALIVLC